ncbi:MAG TPA: HAMP domain-containing sensor histidine kinase [Candidatus Acidoferrales bacterium]|nr:HAMP domain-containing sensor histidine kinase [Candidatus Acidoferrales bacterium]
MFLRNVLSLRHTLVFRLTLWYAGVFTASSLLAFFFFYVGITSIVRARTDAELRESVGEFAALLAQRGLDAVKRAMVLEAKDDGESKVFYRLLTRDGYALASSSLAPWGQVSVSGDALKRLAGGEPHVFETLAFGGREHKARIMYGPLNADTVLQVGWSLEDDDEFLARFQGIFGTTVAAVMLFAALIGWFMAKRALASVEEVTRTARIIAGGDLSQRVPVKGRGSEIDKLAATFNSMLDRIQALVTEMKEMTENIAHDLRSPITRIRGMAEMTLTIGKTIDEYEAAAASTVEDCDRLLEMINTMLYIAEAEALAGRPMAGEVDLAKVARDACDLFQPVAEDQGIALVAQIQDGGRVRGELQALQRMVANLIDNALNYTEPGGTVTVSVNRDDNRAALSVKDTGIGIPQEEIPRIFRRFYRCDRSRSRPGVGLGLSLVKAIVQSHRGDIAVTSTPNLGTTFTVTFPRASADS